MEQHDEACENQSGEDVKEIDLSCLELKTVDVDILSITYHFRPELIQKLVLYGNYLSVLPAAIVNFCHLCHLDVSSNDISWISGEIAQLRKLQVLEIRNNRLANLPKEIQDCLALRTLNLSGNLFRDFPPQLFQLRKLKELYLGGNRIMVVPPLIQNIESLEILYLGGNKISQVPPQLKKLKYLRHLVLCDNLLESIPRELGQLKRLESLSLHKNQLKTLPMEIVMLLNLQELTLRENPLVNTFIQRLEFSPPSLLEICGRLIKTKNIPYNKMMIPRRLTSYLDTAKRCVNPKCDGVYFDSRVKCVQFADFCGKFRLPLEQYLCSPCDGGNLCKEIELVDVEKIQKAYLPRDVVDSD